MATHTDFEHRRRERRRRERLRKKRIRAAILLIAFICIIILALVFITRCVNSGNNGQENSASEAVTLTTEPSSLPVATAEPKKLDIPSATEENNLMNIIENSSAKKYCYLTFDDGPTENITPQILDTLRRYNVKATFFQIGSLIKTNPDMARRVYDEGHLIANHSDGHNYAKLYVSTDTFMNEVNDCYEAIKDVTGEEPFKLVRFPGGGFRSSADSYSPVKQQCKTAMAEYGFYYCDWNALNGDAEGKTKDADELLEYLIDSVEGQNNVVVLMHDAAAKQATADALASIIEYFIGEGYTFHRLDDIVYTPSASASPSASSSSSASSDEDDDDDSSSSSRATSSPSSSSSPSTSPSATASASSTTSPTSTGPIIIN